jgi:hypothetical protein
LFARLLTKPLHIRLEPKPLHRRGNVFSLQHSVTIAVKLAVQLRKITVFVANELAELFKLSASQTVVARAVRTSQRVNSTRDVH